MPAIVCSYEETEALKIALLENIQRQDLGAIEEADAYRRLLDAYGATQDELAGMLGKSRSGVANALRLLTLEDSVRALRPAGQAFSRSRQGSARPAARCPSGAAGTTLRHARPVRPRVRAAGADRAARHPAGASARGPRPRRASGESKEVRALRERAESRLGSPVTISRQPDGKGSLTVAFYSDADLERVLEMMGVDTDLG